MGLLLSRKKYGLVKTLLNLVGDSGRKPGRSFNKKPPKTQKKAEEKNQKIVKPSIKNLLTSNRRDSRGKLRSYKRTL